MGAIQDVNVNTVVDAAVESRAQETGNQSGTSNADTSSGQSNSSGEQSLDEILNLDGVSKFKFGGREWTPESFKKSQMFQQDYTKKTQAVAEKAKYYDALEYDLDKVRSNPALVQEFMQIYPKEFHKYLNLSKARQNEELHHAQAEQGSSQIPPELLQDVQMIKQYVQEKEIAAHEAQLDATFQNLSKKFPEAMEDVVLARAQAYLDKNPGYQLTSEDWGKLFKRNHEEIVKRQEDRQKAKLTNQRQSNAQAKGPGSGGGVPTQAPAKMTMKQATEHMITTLSNRGK